MERSGGHPHPQKKYHKRANKNNRQPRPGELQNYPIQMAKIVNPYLTKLTPLPLSPTQTVIHFVASKNNLDVARQLFSQQYNNNPASARVRDRRGQYALHRAAAAGSVPMVALLVQHKSPLNATDVDGWTALHHAVAEGHADTAVALLKAGAEFDKEAPDGRRALDLAPDKEVSWRNVFTFVSSEKQAGLLTFNHTPQQVRKYIQRMAENEGIEIE